jgi:ectoine hydroxylase-related dioxygenase (phytanoyl-CoA dioxygenase family)
MVTSGYKWLRAVAKREFTGLHCDRVFLGRGSLALLTAWLPLGDVPTERGSLLVVRGSHRLRAFDALRGGYGASEVHRGMRCPVLRLYGKCSAA